MFDKRILMNKKQMFLKKLIWMQMLGMTGGSLPWTTFTGNPIEFDAPKAHSLKSCVVEIEPIQDLSNGDPSPENLCPISGWTEANVYRTGKNLLSPHLYSGIQYNPTVGSTVTLTDATKQFTDNGDGTFSLTTSATWRYYSMVFPCRGFPQIHINIKGKSTGQFGRTTGFLDKDLKVLSAVNTTDSSWTYSANLTPSDNSERAYLYIVLTNRGTASATITITEPMINIGDTALPYEPYQGSSLTLPFGQTVYGGTASYNGDGTWTVTVDRVYFKKKWSDYSSKTTISNYTRGTLKLSNFDLPNAVYPPSASKPQRCSIAPYMLSNGDDSLHFYVNSSYAFVFLKNDTDNNTEIEICYEFTTPTTFTITTAELFDALQGRNVMWTDCSDLTVEAKGTAVELNALQSLNRLLGNRYVNNHTAEDVSDEEALQIILGEQR